MENSRYIHLCHLRNKRISKSKTTKREQMKENKLAKKIRTIIFEEAMPIYFPKTNEFDGYCIAIWNCGTRPQGLWQAIKDTRITIRKDGLFKKEIKRGDYKPIKD